MRQIFLFIPHLFHKFYFIWTTFLYVCVLQVALLALPQRKKTLVWEYNKSPERWENVVPTFTNRQWLENFQMSEDTFLFICNKLRSAMALAAVLAISSLLRSIFSRLRPPSNCLASRAWRRSDSTCSERYAIWCLLFPDKLFITTASSVACPVRQLLPERKKNMYWNSWLRQGSRESDQDGCLRLFSAPGLL